MMTYFYSNRIHSDQMKPVLPPNRQVSSIWRHPHWKSFFCVDLLYIFLGKEKCFIKTIFMNFVN